MEEILLHLLTMVIGMVVSLVLFSADIKRIGEIPMGLPDFQFPHLDMSMIKVILIDGAVRYVGVY